ncbi:MAG: hypothetical protein AB1847_05685 [bacterium]
MQVTYQASRSRRPLFIITTLILLSGLVLLSRGFCFGKEREMSKLSYRSFLPSRSPERYLPVQATRRILRERESFLGLTSCVYQIEKNDLAPYQGKIKVNTEGYALVVVGYHYLEKPWGKIFKEEFQKHVYDPDGRVLFLEIKNNDVLTGDNSPASSREIREFITGFPGRIGLVIEVHEHLSDENKFSGNEWPPYWYQLDDRTGGDSGIKYTILDPYIPWFCIRDYFEYHQRIRIAEMQKAVNETLRYTVNIINDVLNTQSLVNNIP